MQMETHINNAVHIGAHQTINAAELVVPSETGFQTGSYRDSSM
jgi:hypothetical protein